MGDGHVASNEVNLKHEKYWYLSFGILMPDDHAFPRNQLTH